MKRAPSTAWMLCLALAGCRCVQPTQSAPSAADAGPPRVDFAREQAWPEAYATDALWQRARGGGDFDEARLAQRESASSLLAALMHGGSLGRTALRALSYARDRYAVRGELCSVALAAEPSSQGLLIAAIHDALAAGPASEEAVDTRADATCRRALSDLGKRSHLSPTDRDRASAGAALLERGR